MHKGYTLNYFIRFFSEIPTSQWICGSLTNSNELNDGCHKAMKACAVGFAGAYEAKEVTEYNQCSDTEESFYLETRSNTPARENALLALLPKTIEINDAVEGDHYYKLGNTPRTRILKALKLRKKLGPNWADEL